MLTVNRSDIGRIRMANEDRSWAGVTSGGLTMAIVADGMGGHQAGDVASQLAVDAFREAMEPLQAGASAEEAQRCLREAIARANEVVYDMASRNEQYHNMGTTVVAALFIEESLLVIGHIGDSRAYRISSGSAITQLTEDHTLVNELVRSGQISAEEAAHHPRRNVLTRALGTDDEVELDVQTFDWSGDDILLLCSDGLSGMISDEDILQAVSAQASLDEKADRLISMALAAGGDDNITVVLLQSGAGTGGEE